MASVQPSSGWSSTTVRYATRSEKLPLPQENLTEIVDPCVHGGLPLNAGWFKLNWQRGVATVPLNTTNLEISSSVPDSPGSSSGLIEGKKYWVMS